MEKQKVRMVNTNPKSRFYNRVREFSEGFAKSRYAQGEGWVRQEMPKSAPVQPTNKADEPVVPVSIPEIIEATFEPEVEAKTPKMTDSTEKTPTEEKPINNTPVAKKKPGRKPSAKTK